MVLFIVGLNGAGTAGTRGRHQGIISGANLDSGPSMDLNVPGFLRLSKMVEQFERLGVWPEIRRFTSNPTASA